MSHHFTILNKDEYKAVREMRFEKQRQERLIAERPYMYSDEKAAELLAQRDLPHELNTLKRCKKGVVATLWTLSVICGFCGGRMLRTGKIQNAVLAETLAVSLVVMTGFKYRSYNHKIRIKEDEIVFAEKGLICPRIELFRQEGKSY